MNDEAAFVPMSDEERRARLRDIFRLLDELDAGLPAVGFDLESGGIEDAKERLKDKFGKDYLTTCEGCSCDLFVGDHGHRCLEGETLCRDCTPSWDDVKGQWEDGTLQGDDGGDGSDKASFMARYHAHIAHGGKGTDLMLYTL